MSTTQREFKDVRLVTCKGTVIALARDTTQTDCNILWYNILDLDVASSNDSLDWTGFTKLIFPTALRPAGMALVDADLTMMPELGTADAPFGVMGDEEYVHIFRQSSLDTLWYNRFRLTRGETNSNGDAPLILAPAWEVRFRESNRFAYADSTRDPQSSLNADGEPYLEPIYDLSFISGLQGGRFAVTATDSPTIGGRIWHIFTTDASTAVVKHFAIPSTEAAPFDLTAITLNNDYTISPVDTITLQDSVGGALTTTGGPAVQLYARRVRHISDTGDSMLSRELRVMFAQPVVSGANPSGMALLDFGVAAEGTLARPPATLPLADLKQANYCMNFRAGNDVTLPNTGGSLNVTGSFEIDVWLRPDSNQPTRVQVIGDENTGHDRGPYLDLVEGGRIAIGFGTGSATFEAQSTTLVVLSNTWTHVTASFTSGGSSGTFSASINGDAVSLTDAAAAANPNGPIVRLSRSSGCYLGQMDQLEITINGVVVSTWELDQIDYNVDPPTTPDSSGSNPGAVRSHAHRWSNTAPDDQWRRHCCG